MRLVFFGSGAFGLPTLRAIAAEHELLAIVTQPDRPAGRSRGLTPTPVGEWAQQNAPEIPLLKPEKVNERETVERIRAFEVGTPDERRGAWVVIAFGQKLSQRLLADRCAMNLHASLLPRWRGAAPINHAILAGDRETGNSVITLAEEMDAGLVLGQSRRPVEPEQTAGELHDLLAEDGPALVLDVLRRHEQGTLRPFEQDEDGVTYAPKLTKSDGMDETVEPADVQQRRIHGLNPWPGVTVSFRGQPLKLHRAKVIAFQPEQQVAPGCLADGEQGVLACAEATHLRILEVQPPGKRAMTWSDFARGARPERGERLIGGED